VVVSVGGMSPNGVYGSMARTFCFDSDLVSLFCIGEDLSIDYAGKDPNSSNHGYPTSRGTPERKSGYRYQLDQGNLVEQDHHGLELDRWIYTNRQASSDQWCKSA
jgi:hypothetical protein